MNEQWRERLRQAVQQHRLELRRPPSASPKQPAKSANPAAIVNAAELTRLSWSCSSGSALDAAHAAPLLPPQLNDYAGCAASAGT